MKGVSHVSDQVKYITMQHIPRIVACNPLLSPSDKIIYSCIYFIQQTSNLFCIVSNKYLADYNQLSIIAVQKSLTKLESLKYIKRKMIENPINSFVYERQLYIGYPSIWKILMDLWNDGFLRKNIKSKNIYLKIKERLIKNISFDEAKCHIIKICNKNKIDFKDDILDCDETINMYHNKKQLNRFYKSKRKTKPIPKGLRFKILKKNNFKCSYCGVGHEETKLTIDHIIPASKGGKDCEENYTTACFECNIGKSNILLSDKDK
jgi:hypothetical protein